jgi:hypothetical protein
LREAFANGHWQDIQLEIIPPYHEIPENIVLLTENISLMQETIMYLILSFPSIQHGQASKELK